MRWRRAVPLMVGCALVLSSCSRAAVSKPTPTTASQSAPADTSSTIAQSAAALQGGSVPISVPTGPTVSPPASIASDCSVDVSLVLKKWLQSLPAGRTVLMAPGSCYLVDTGIKLVDRQGLTMFGGTFRNESDSVSPGENSKGAAVFTFVGGSDIALEDMHIYGANPGGYHPRLAFDGGIELEGTNGATIRSDTISDTFGDGVTLAPLRGGADHNSGQILAPSSQVSIRDVTVDGAGRQGDSRSGQTSQDRRRRAVRGARGRPHALGLGVTPGLCL